MLLFPFRIGRLFDKGDLKYVMLKALRVKPMHGYEIIKTIASDFSDFYVPSPGVVYPTLQMLEDLGYVRMEEENGRKTYSITESGEKLLDGKEKEVKELLARKKRFFPEERMELIKEGRKLAKLIFMNFGDLTPSKAEKIRKVLEEARKKVTAIALEE